jgi:hypothetical protein
MSTEIDMKVKQAKEAEKQIDETHNTSKSMTVRGSVLMRREANTLLWV